MAPRDIPINRANDTWSRRIERMNVEQAVEEEENAEEEEEVQRILHNSPTHFSSHRVITYRQIAIWRFRSSVLTSGDFNARFHTIGPLPPSGVAITSMYKKCYDSPPPTDDGFCCVNHCHKYESVTRESQCDICYSMEHVSQPNRAPPCRCDCRVYQHDAFWTCVGLGEFLYTDVKSRQCTFVTTTANSSSSSSSSSSSRNELRRMLYNILSILGFVRLQQQSSQSNGGDTSSTITIRCVSCLFLKRLTYNADLRKVNREHGHFNPCCYFVQMPYDSVDAINASIMAYRFRFQNLQTVQYVRNDFCSC